MNTLQEYIKNNNFEDISQFINYVESKMVGRVSTMISLYDYYNGKTDIKSRILANTNKVNNKLSNDFFGTIIDDKVGYMGNTIKTTIDTSGYSKDDYEYNIRFIEDWEHENDVEDINADTIKLASICGYSARLLYNGLAGAKVRIVPRPWEVTVIKDDDTLEPILGFWFYDKSVYENGVEKVIKVVEVYDSTSVVTYNKKTSVWELVKEEVHLFTGVPLIIIDNNSEKVGDYEKAIELINAYDKALSDVSSEMEQLRLAYAILKGSSLDDEIIEQMKKTGILVIDKEGSFEFSSKTLDAESIRLLLNELRRNIFAFCKSIDFSEVVSGDIRVLGWQTKLMPLENKCKIAERKMISGLRYQYRLLTDYWRIHGYADIDYRDINWKFTRNIPRDIAGESDTLVKLMNTIDKRTALEQITFIENPDEVIGRMEGENNENKKVEKKPEVVVEPVIIENKSGSLLDR